MSPTENIPKCAGCEQPILDRFILKVLDRSWHAKCLQCADCGTQLSDRCFSRGDKFSVKKIFLSKYACAKSCEFSFTTYNCALSGLLIHVNLLVKIISLNVLI